MAAPKQAQDNIGPPDYARSDESRRTTTYLSPFYELCRRVDSTECPSADYLLRHFAPLKVPLRAQAARRRRIAALKAAEGLWKDRTDVQDGIEYQEQMRAEWP
jgi:hypothetical protein